MKNYMGGAHLSHFGLHLGHFYGSIVPLIYNKQLSDGKVFFIIGDIGAIGKRCVRNYDEDLKYMVSQLLAINEIYDLNIKIIRMSTLKFHFTQVYQHLCEMTTLSQITSVHKCLNNPCYLDDFLFPLDTVLSCVLLNVSDVLLTGNDKKIIDFCRKVIKKYNLFYGCTLNIPKLYYEKDDFICGYNYKKMSNQNDNCIFFKDDEKTLHQKTTKLFDFKYLSKYNGDFYAYYLKHHNQFVYTEEFLPLTYLRKFFLIDDTIINELKLSYNKDLLYEILFQKLLKLNTSISYETANIISTNDVNEILLQHEEYVKRHIRVFLN